MNNLTHFQIGDTYHSTFGPIQITGKSFIKPNHWYKNFDDPLDTVYYKYKCLNNKRKEDYFASRSGIADSLLLIKSNINLTFKIYI